MNRFRQLILSKKVYAPLINLLSLLFSLIIFFKGQNLSLFNALFRLEELSDLDYYFTLEASITQGIFLLLCVITSLFAILQKKSKIDIYLLIPEIACPILTIIYSYMAGNPSIAILSLFEAVLSFLLFIFLLLSERKRCLNEPEEQEEDKTTDPRTIRRLSIGEVILSTTAFISSIVCLFLPVYNLDVVHTYRLVDALYPDCKIPVILIGFLLSFLVFLFFLIGLTKSFSSFHASLQKLVINSKNLLYLGLGYSLIFYLFGTVVGRFYSPETIENAFLFQAIPFFVNAILLILESFLSAPYLHQKDDEGKEFRLTSRTVLLIFSFVLSALGILTTLSDLLSITVIQSVNNITTNVNGLDVLRHYKAMGQGYQTLAFLLFATILTIVLFFIFELATFFRRSRSFYRLSYTGIVVCYLFIFGLFLFGFYYKIAVKMNESSIRSFLLYAGYHLDSFSYEISVSPLSWPYFLIASLAMIALVLVKPFTRHLQEESIDVNIHASEGVDALSSDQEPLTNGGLKGEDNPCPAFLEIDRKEEDEAARQEQKKSDAFEQPSLAKITDYLIRYAKNSRLHLSYSPEMIASFLAGLGVSKLSILQGMSGTGKTSLPKIFCEAFKADCRIVEVESSWKDKNELIGYYNEFTKLFTPKKFTQALYASTLNPENITLIVLDEMNLSRIEYYFSDFLSLMENEPEKRNFRVVNVPLYYLQDGERKAYKGLKDGQTIAVSPNIWFIGTANRDESTFEISDKVYDRANTLNFDTRAPKAIPDGAPLKPSYLSYEVLNQLFEEAKKNDSFTLANDTVLPRAERLLAPYNISYGNRVANQMEDFVKIYCACFPHPEEKRKEALEAIFLSKVVHKLEYRSVENKDELSQEFSRLGWNQCAAFISRLSEDE